MLKLFIRISFALVTLILIQSCREQGKGWTVDGLVPLVDSRLDLNDIFDDSVLVAGDENVLTLVYSDQIFDFKLEEFSTPDTSISQKYPGPGIAITWDKRAPLISDTSKNTLDIDDADLIEVKILSGSIDIDVQSFVGESIYITYVMPGAIKNGNPLRITRQLPAGAVGNPGTVSETIVLDGYTVNLRGIDQNDYNTLIYFIEVEFVDKFNPDTTYQYKPTDDIYIDQKFNAIMPEYGRGIFRTQTISVEGEDDDTLDIFQNVVGGDLDLKSAEVSIDFTNFIGADLQGNIKGLTSINHQTSDEVELSGPVLGQSVNITRARIDQQLPYPPVVPTRTSFKVDENNSNIDELIENFPNQLKYNVEFEINPDGNVSGANDFFYSDYGIQGDLNIEIPLNIQADGFILLDTSDFSASDDEEFENITGGHMRIYAENWYPFEASVKVTLLDKDNNELIEVLLPDSKVNAAIPDDDGRVRTPMESLISAPVSQDILLNYFRAEKAIIEIGISTEGQEHRKVYSNYFCGVKIIGDINYNLVIE